jgi:hypothetical protein
LKTNEQAVAEAEDQLSNLKGEYLFFLTPIAIKTKSDNYTPTLEELLSCQQLANKYFNYLESFVGTSDLFGAHNSGLWITGFAETCRSVLNAYVVHVNFLRSHKEILGSENIEPDLLAFANMQRIVKQYLDAEHSGNLHALYHKNNLPESGFKVEAHKNIQKTPKWQTITSVAIGLIAVITVLVLSVIIPEPTEWQGFVFRGCFALGLAAVAVIVPGFLNVDAQVRGAGNYFKIVAGGAIAIFVIIWLINPPSIQSASPVSVQDSAHKSLQQNTNSSVE